MKKPKLNKVFELIKNNKIKDALLLIKEKDNVNELDSEGTSILEYICEKSSNVKVC